MLIIYNPTPWRKILIRYISSLFLFVILQEAIFYCDRSNGLFMEVLGLH